MKALALNAVCSHLAFQELLGPRYVAFVQMLHDDRDVRVFLGQALEIQIKIQLAKPRRWQLNFANTAESMTFSRTIVPYVAMFLALVVARTLHILGMANTDPVRQRIKDLIENFVHAVNVMGFKIVGWIHKQAQARMVNFRKHPQRL